MVNIVATNTTRKAHIQFSDYYETRTIIIICGQNGIENIDNFVLCDINNIMNNYIETADLAMLNIIVIIASILGVSLSLLCTYARGITHAAS